MIMHSIIHSLTIDIRAAIYLYIYPFVHPSTYIYLSIHPPSIHLSTLSTNPSICLSASIYLSIYIYLSIPLSLSTSTHDIHDSTYLCFIVLDIACFHPSLCWSWCIILTIACDNENEDDASIGYPDLDLSVSGFLNKNLSSLVENEWIWSCEE